LAWAGPRESCRAGCITRSQSRKTAPAASACDFGVLVAGTSAADKTSHRPHGPATVHSASPAPVLRRLSRRFRIGAPFLGFVSLQRIQPRRADRTGRARSRPHPASTLAAARASLSRETGKPRPCGFIAVEADRCSPACGDCEKGLVKHRHPLLTRRFAEKAAEAWRTSAVLSAEGMKLYANG
jgi:hypothetical protein